MLFFYPIQGYSVHSFRTYTNDNLLFLYKLFFTYYQPHPLTEELGCFHSRLSPTSICGSCWLFHTAYCHTIRYPIDCLHAPTLVGRFTILLHGLHMVRSTRFLSKLHHVRFVVRPCYSTIPSTLHNSLTHSPQFSHNSINCWYMVGVPRHPCGHTLVAANSLQP